MHISQKSIYLIVVAVLATDFHAYTKL